MKRFEALEEKIRKAAALIRALREERASMEKRLAERDGEIEDLRSTLAENEAAGADESAMQELEGLRAERREIIARVEKMMRLLDDASALAGREDLLAALDEND